MTYFEEQVNSNKRNNYNDYQLHSEILGAKCVQQRETLMK